MRPEAHIGWAVLALCLLAPVSAQAYCRTTTCDPRNPEQNCFPDATGCIQEGLPLIWPERCIHFGTQKDGSPLRGISYARANEVIQQAYRQWFSVDCGDGQRPSFEIWDVGEIFCDDPEFNQNEPNANVWMFRDTDWPYTGAASTLALTTITFEVPTGQILDADVEVNTFNIQITTSDSNVQNDLQSIATHEAGHFLGLSHSHIAAATMFANYAPGDIDFRTLHPDDMDGICAIYPPDRDAPTCSGPRPRHGFSRHCAEPVERSRGCAVVPGSSEGADPRAGGIAGLAVGLFGASLAAAWRRRRSPR
jgi:hypothetical protein